MNIALGPFAAVIGWREGLLGLVLLLALYMVIVVWRMRRLKHKEPVVAGPVEPTVRASAGAAAYAATAQVESADLPTLADIAPVRAEPPAPPPADSETVRQLRFEVAQMRDELDALRAEFAALRTDLRQETAQMKATQTASPLYSDAMQMAQAGHAAQTIAERCGISRAEAELVVALVRSQT